MSILDNEEKLINDSDKSTQDWKDAEERKKDPYKDASWTIRSYDESGSAHTYISDDSHKIFMESCKDNFYNKIYKFF